MSDQQKVASTDTKSKAAHEKMTIFVFPKKLGGNIWPKCCKELDSIAIDTEVLLSLWKILPWTSKERLFLSVHFGVPTGVRCYYWWHSTELIWIFRNVIVDTDTNTADGENRLRRAFDAMESIHNIGESGSTKVERKWFGEIGLTASINTLIGQDRRGDHANRYCTLNEMALARLLARNCIVYIDHLAIKIAEFSKLFRDSTHALRKLASTPLKYVPEDRQQILDVLGGKRSSTEDTYLERLCELLGKDRFEKLAFGKLKSCGHCGKSNREKQLLCCKSCATSGIRPKRRYCDQNCQKADWIEHRKLHKSKDEKSTLAAAKTDQ